MIEKTNKNSLGTKETNIWLITILIKPPDMTWLFNSNVIPLTCASVRLGMSENTVMWKLLSDYLGGFKRPTTKSNFKKSTTPKNKKYIQKDNATALHTQKWNNTGHRFSNLSMPNTDTLNKQTHAAHIKM